MSYTPPTPGFPSDPAFELSAQYYDSRGVTTLVSGRVSVLKNYAVQTLPRLQQSDAGKRPIQLGDYILFDSSRQDALIATTSNYDIENLCFCWTGQVMSDSAQPIVTNSAGTFGLFARYNNSNGFGGGEFTYAILANGTYFPTKHIVGGVQTVLVNSTADGCEVRVNGVPDILAPLAAGTTGSFPRIGGPSASQLFRGVGVIEEAFAAANGLRHVERHFAGLLGLPTMPLAACFVMGDSIGFGYYSSASHTAVMPLVAVLCPQVSIVNVSVPGQIYGYPGGNVSDYFDRLPAGVKRIGVIQGTNNEFVVGVYPTAQTAAQAFAHYQAHYDAAKASMDEIIVIPPMADSRVAYATTSALAALIAGDATRPHRVVVLPAGLAGSTLSATYSTDGIHLTDVGHALLAPAVADAINAATATAGNIIVIED